LKGKVVRWLTGRGYGFIEPEEGGKDVFVHYSEIENAYLLKEGQKVEFNIEPSDKGPRAINVEVLEEEEEEEEE